MMPTFLRLLVVSALVLPILVDASPSSTSPIPLNPKGIAPIPIPFIDNLLAGAKRANLPETNAQRMKRGLGPKRPKHRYPKRALHPRQSSSPCVNPTGFIGVEYVNGDGATVDGYVASAPNEFGEYSFIQGQDTALRVQLNNCNLDGEPFDILTLTGIANEPYLGLIDGFSNETPTLGPGSYNYVYLGGTSQTPSGSAPLVQSNSFTDATNIPESVESAVWELASNGVLTASWVNPDTTSPPQVLLFVPSAGTFTVTGDYQAFRDTFGPAFPVTFTFIPA
ncbi:hypothetical protein BXZ70DRAFT_952090 [Cristinia sonorae]|uniref:Uncharacterized protein n=1 Tax=Cristinia sonorae TaxID=1940300 RepID=A0A8K0UHB6_9AGAR|nr:hypothetical protein BXZ70DRAFT_952090 [Cristinia sonorae]